MSNTASGAVWVSNLPVETSAVYGVPNAAQSLAGFARVATTVEVGVIEDEVMVDIVVREGEEDKVDVEEGNADDDDDDDN